MIKKEKEIEAEKLLEEQAETLKPRRGRPRKVEVDKSLESTELAEEKGFAYYKQRNSGNIVKLAINN